MNTELQTTSVTEKSPASAAPDDSLATRHGASIAQGLLKHGEHFPDLILVQGATRDRRFFETFRSMTAGLVAAIESGSMTVNEKVDGLAALTLGRDSKNRPFLATKHGLDKKRGPQKLMTSADSVRRAYPSNAELRKMFQECFRLLKPRLDQVLSGEHKDLVIQGDIVFTTSMSKKEETADGVRFTPNAVQYSVQSSDPLYNKVKDAYVGVVIHTVYKRVIEPGTKLVKVEPHPDLHLVRELADKLSSPHVAVFHPWRDDVKIEAAPDFKQRTGQLVRDLLEGIDSRLKLLGDDFIGAWNTAHLDRFRVFINTGLNPPMHGGLFKAARLGELFEPNKFVEGMRAWVAKRALRETPSAQAKDDSYFKYQEKFEALVRDHPVELRAMLEAFYGAVQVQDALIPHLKSPLASRFGGQPGEGIMLRSDGMVVKFIDRLDFTMRNNSRWNRGTLAPPFDAWRAGTRIIPMKAQPLHAGHVAMIRKIAAEAGGAPVIVLASRKEPNPRATTWKALKAADSKGELAEGKYTHLFSRGLRAKLLKEADLGGAVVCMTDTKILESYLGRAHEAKAQGKVFLVTGEKELGTPRYRDMLDRYEPLIEQVASPAQAGGVSGTEVRAALKSYAATGDAPSLAKLHEALSYVESEKKRQALIERMVKEFTKIEKAAQKVLLPKVKKRARRSEKAPAV